MRSLTTLAALAASCIATSYGQQYAGDTIPNSLPGIPGSEITYFRVNDASGKNNNLTLINYYSHGINNNRVVESNVQRAVVVIHGLNRDPGTYMSNMLSALAQTTPANPNVNFDSVVIMAPYFPNGDDKDYGYPWTTGLSPGRGSTTNALVWQASQWSAGANNQYPYTSHTTSSYTALDQIIQYFDNATLFPRLNQIVIAGHSLGGQTVQRYTAIGNQLNTRTPVSYWIGNPNSYAWLSTDRPLPIATCSIYDVYREGFTNFTTYPMTYGTSVVASGRAAVLANMNSKAINYARGMQDLGDDSSSCAPYTTGNNRNERFFNFISAWPPSCTSPTGRNCDTVDLINTGHDAGAMFASAAGQARLFLDNFNGNGSRSYDFGYPREQVGDDPYPNPALNGTASSVNNNTYAGNMTYQGCWSDQVPQSLTFLSYSSNTNTIEMCTQACTAANYTIAGLEATTQCFCGHSLGYEATQVVENSCQFSCPGNSNEICGGYNRLSLFSNGRPQLQEAPGTPETMGNFYYTGCYTEATTGRALTSSSTSGTFMTLEYCANYCSAYQYFGTEYSLECYCGNSFASGANRTSDSDCSQLCAADMTEFCGAGNRLSVYQNPAWSSSISTLTTTTTTTTAVTVATSSAIVQATALSCPTSDNVTVQSYGRNFTIECGIDHQGGDLTSLSVNTFQQCIDTCAQNSQCVDISLSGTACYLKSTLGIALSNGGVWGARLNVSTVSTSSLATFPISSTIASSSSSVSTSTTAPTTTPTTTPTNTTASPFTTASTSAIVSASLGPVCPNANSTTIVSNGVSFLVECGIDHAGGDMLALGVTSFQQCINACATTPGCVDLSMSGNGCYLKSTLGVPVFNGVWGAKVVSGSGGSSTVTNSSSSASASTSTSSVSSLTSTSSTSLGPSTMSTTSTTLTSSTSPGASPISNTASSTTISAASISSTTSGVSQTSTSTTIVGLSSNSGSSSALSLVSSSTSTSTFVMPTATPISTASITSSAPTSMPSAGSSSITSTILSSSSASSTIPSSTSLASSTFSTVTMLSSPVTSTSSSTTSTTTMSSTIALLPSAFSSLGCFIDSSTRALPQSNGSSTLQTPQLCALACQAQSYKYSSTEYASECWCGNALPTLPAPQSDCSMPCKGDPSQPCGAGNRLSVMVDNTWQQSFFTLSHYRGANYPANDAGWDLSGCYVEGTAGRALPVGVSMAAYGGAANATVGNCLDACRDAGLGVCGLEYHQECWGGLMGNVSTAVAAVAECGFPCKGNASEACGGANRLLVYVHDGLTL